MIRCVFGTQSNILDGAFMKIAKISLKKRLKGKEISITESLTKTRMAKLNEARDVFGFTNVWTSDGRILYKQDGEERTKIYYD